MSIGIVTLSYNQGKFLEEAIHSVKITHPKNRLEYIIVDPGSSDGSREIIEKHVNCFSKIVFEPDQGPADGLNKGFKYCDTEILGYLNADDKFTPGALDYVLDFFRSHSEVDVLIGASLILDTNGKPRRMASIPTNYSLRRFFMGTNNAPQQSTFFRASSFRRIQGFNTINRTCWDGELLIDLKLSGARFYCENKVLGCFRIHQNSITGSNRLAEQFWKDNARMQQKISDAGIRRPTAWETRLFRALHYVNPVRRLAQYLAGKAHA